MGVILKNNSVSTITTTISASDVGIAVAAGTGSLFPALGAGDYFYATLVSSGGTYEIVKVTARVSDTMTIVRAQEGTTAQSFAAGSRIESRITAASIVDAKNDVLTTTGTLTNKTINLSDNTLTGTLAQFNTACSDADFASTATAQTLTNKTLTLGSNTVSGTLAQFNTACTDADFQPTTFTPSGTGAVQRTVVSKLVEYVSPADFGAVGDGVADDTTPIRNALQYCSDTGVPFRAFGGATYRIASAITINRTNGKPVVIDWGGAKVVASGAGIQFIGNGTAYLNTTLATEIDRDDPSINLTSVAGIAKGDLLEILSPALTGGTISTHHYYVVNEVIGNNVFIEGTTVADVKNQQIIDSGQTGSITVAAYRVAAPITVENATFEIIDPTGVLSGLNFEWHSKVNIKNIDFTGKCRQQLRVIFSGQLDVGGCTFRDFGYVEGNSGYANLPSAPGGLSYGYGTLVARVWQTLFHDNTGLRGWHTVDFSRGSMKALVSDCSFNRNAFAVSTHEGAWYTEVRNCMFDGTGGITLVRGIYGVVQGCHFKGMNEHGIVYGGNMVDVRIADNKIEYNPGVVNLFSAVYYDVGGPSTPVAGAASTGFTRVFEMVGNTFVGRSRCYAGFNNSADGKTVVADNSFMGGVSLIALYAGKNTYVRNNSFSNIDQSAINLVLGSGNPEVVCNGNSQAGDMVTYSNSGLFYLTGSGTPLLHFENNSTETEYLIRFNSNLTVKSVVNCAGRAARLFLGTGTVTNAINNYYVTTIAFTTTVTNSVNNQLLA